MEIVSESLDEWLSTLKPFQRNTIKNLLQNNDGNEEKVAELWLNSFGPINTATYGVFQLPLQIKTISKV